MKILLLFPILLLALHTPLQSASSDDSPVTVVESKWFKAQKGPYDPGAASLPENSGSDVVPVKGELERRISSRATVRDPSSDPIDRRGDELDREADKSVNPKRSSAEGYTYQAKILNNSNKTIETVFWEFKFIEKADPANVSRRQFVCRASLKPEKRKVLESFSRNGPDSVVNVKTLNKNENDAFESSVIINRVEYDDGSTWQRKGWNFDDVKLTLKPPETRKQQPCQGL
jgi:hypothetical protein